MGSNKYKYYILVLYSTTDSYSNTTIYKVIVANYLQYTTFNKEELLSLDRSRHAIYNIDIYGNVITNLYNKLYPLYKIGKGIYAVADNNCNIVEMTIGDIKNNRDKFSGIQFNGNGIHGIAGPIHEMSKWTELNYKMILFNNKSRVIGAHEIAYSINEHEQIVAVRVKNRNKEADLYIPGIVNTIGHSSFSREQCINKVVIGEGVESIADLAFSNSSITSVSIPSTVKYIGNRSFYSCTNMKEISIKNGAKYIGKSAFFGTKINKIKLGSKVNRIEDYAFAQSNLQYLDLGDTDIRTLNTNIIAGCNIKSLILPSKLEVLTIEEIPNFSNIEQFIMSSEITDIYVMHSMVPRYNVMRNKLKGYLEYCIRNKTQINIAELKLYVEQ